MFFTRYFTNGESHKQKFAVFHCKTCNKDEYYPVLRDPYPTDPKACPTCKTINDSDRKEDLLKKRDTLAQQISRLQHELDTVNVELVTLEPIAKEKLHAQSL